MKKFILVSYKLRGTKGKIMVKEGTNEEQIKEICVINSLQEDIKKLAKEVNLKNE